MSIFTYIKRILSFNKSPFILKLDFNKFSSLSCFELIQKYKTKEKTLIKLGVTNFEYEVGYSYNEYISDENWIKHFEKLFIQYSDLCGECFAYGYIAKVIHKLWHVNPNFDKRFTINPTNNSIFSLLTCLTVLSDKSILVNFKHFKSVSLKKGETLMFPSHFEYYYDISHNNKEGAEILMSQVYLEM
jgi:hypothetical protein